MLEKRFERSTEKLMWVKKTDISCEKDVLGTFLRDINNVIMKHLLWKQLIKNKFRRNNSYPRGRLKLSIT